MVAISFAFFLRERDQSRRSSEKEQVDQVCTYF